MTPHTLVFYLFYLILGTWVDNFRLLLKFGGFSGPEPVPSRLPLWYRLYIQPSPNHASAWSS